MKINKIITSAVLTMLFVSGCSSNEEIKPSSLEVIKDEIKLIIDTERDLNDLVSVNFEPQNVTNKDVIYETNETHVFSLEGSKIKANNLGSGSIKVTSVSNPAVSDEFLVTVYNPTKESYKINYNLSDDYIITGLEQAYYVEDDVSFAIEVINEQKIVDTVTMNGNKLTSNESNEYSFKMPNMDVNLEITLKDKPASYKVNYSNSNEYTITGLNEYYFEGEKVTFAIQIAADIQKVVDVVTVNSEIINAESANQYSFIMPNMTVNIEVTLKDKPVSTNKEFGKYNIECSETGKLTTGDEIFNTFKFDTTTGENEIIESVAASNNIAAGGYGGSGTNRWKLQNLLKFGSTSLFDGYITLNLKEEINRITIFGYIHNNKTTVQVGDVNSKDWGATDKDNKTTTVICSDMTIASKTTVEANQVSSLVIDFVATKTLKIAVINKGPLFMTGISFSYCAGE